MAEAPAPVLDLETAVAASTDEPADSACLAPELESAIHRTSRPELRETVGPADVALCYLYARTGAARVQPLQRDRARRHLATVIAACEEGGERRGPRRIIRSCYSTQSLAAAALCDDGEGGIIVGRLPREVADLRTVLVRARELSFEVSRRLRDDDLRLCQDEIFSCVAEVLQTLDDRLDPTMPSTDDCTPVGRHEADLEAARRFMERCATRRAKATYVIGMAKAAAVLGAVLLAAALAIELVGTWTPLSRQLLLVPVAGAAGAVLSVLWRLTSAIDLPGLSPESQGRYVQLLAGLRPVVGALSALALFAVLLSPLVPLDRGPSATAFYVAVAVLAGFSERLAPDMFLRASRTLHEPEGVPVADARERPAP